MAIACCTCATASWSTASRPIDMRTLWRGIARTVFWSYERGSRQYDVMVGVILLFVLFTPRHWFHDRPQGSEFSTSGVQFISEDNTTQIELYRVQARMLPLEKRTPKTTPELEREIHGILSNTAGELKGQTFQIREIDPFSPPGGSVVYYDVSVHVSQPDGNP